MDKTVFAEEARAWIQQQRKLKEAERDFLKSVQSRIGEAGEVALASPFLYGTLAELFPASVTP